jgi:hypothetical protein
MQKFVAKYQKTVEAIANHIQKDYKGGPEIAKALRDLSLPVISIPDYPTGTGGVVDLGMEYLWKEDVKEAKRKIPLLDENKKRAYALVVGQCLPELVSKIRGLDLYAQANVDQDAVKLLLIIRGYCCSFDANQQSMCALEGAKQQVQVFNQGYDVNVMDDVEYFMALVGVVETYGGVYGNEPGHLREQLIKQGVTAADMDMTAANGSPNVAKIKKALVVTRKCYLSCMILLGSDNSRFYQVKTDLQNDMTKGTNNFPKTVAETTCLLSKYKVPPRHVRAREPDSKGVAFVQGSGERKPAIGTIDCWHCGKLGHCKTSCPELQIVGVQNLNIEDCVQEHSLFSADNDYEMLQ